MKHIIEKWDQNVHESAMWKFYFEDLDVGILDIETTGLDAARNKFVLGCLYNKGTGELHQVMAASRGEEVQALGEYLKLLADIDMVVTYNGRHFDLPFLYRRWEAAGMPASFPQVFNLDLYLVLSGHSPIKKLVPNMKQKTVEAYMGFWDSRSDEISGAESVELFNHYEATGDAQTEAKILLHNNDDVRQLTKLTKAIIKSDFHKAMYRQGFPIKSGAQLLKTEKIRIGRDGLCISGIQLRSPINYIGFELNGWPVMSRFKRSGGRDPGRFEITVPAVRQSGFTAVDLQAAGLMQEQFEQYPECAGGFLVIEDRNGIRYRETNHFVKAFTTKLMEEAT